TWAEKRGWVYYRQLGGRGVFAAMSNAMAEFEVVVNPAAEHRLEEERSGSSPPKSPAGAWRKTLNSRTSRCRRSKARPAPRPLRTEHTPRIASGSVDRGARFASGCCL